MEVLISTAAAGCTGGEQLQVPSLGVEAEVGTAQASKAMRVRMRMRVGVGMRRQEPVRIVLLLVPDRSKEAGTERAIRTGSLRKCLSSSAGY